MFQQQQRLYSHPHAQKVIKIVSIHQVNNLGLENKLEQLACVSGCTDVGYEALQLL